MAATMDRVQLVKEPAYCRIQSERNSEIEKVLVKGKKGLQLLPNLHSLHEVLTKENELVKIVTSPRHLQLRREKCMQLIKRVKACLLRVPLMEKLFTYGAHLLKDVNIASSEIELLYMPCKQSWTYTLYLTCQYYELLQRAMSYSLSAFQFVTSSLTIKHLVRVHFMYMAICARVWQICQALSDKLADVYNLIYSVHGNIEASKSDWECPDLPDKLLRSSLSQKPKSSAESDKTHMENSKLTVNGEPLNIEDFASSSPVDLLNCLPISESHEMDDDIGVSIGVEEFQRLKKRKAEPVKMENSPNMKKKKTEKHSKIKKKKIKKMNDSKDINDNGCIFNGSKKSQIVSADSTDSSMELSVHMPILYVKEKRKKEKIKNVMQKNLTVPASNESMKMKKKKKKELFIEVKEDTGNILSFGETHCDDKNTKVKLKGFGKKKRTELLKDVTRNDISIGEMTCDDSHAATLSKRLTKKKKKKLMNQKMSQLT